MPVRSHDPRQLESLFQALFLDSFRTRLEGGAPEPLYLPSKEPAIQPHRVVYREDYFASALHEIAHWCLAGAKRRELEDYGYWYAEDGRTAAQQAEFERVEVKPQALEWIFSDAADFEFHLSADNLSLGCGPSAKFESAVRAQKERFLSSGLPARAATFLDGLRAEGPVQTGGSADERRNA